MKVQLPGGVVNGLTGFFPSGRMFNTRVKTDIPEWEKFLEKQIVASADGESMTFQVKKLKLEDEWLAGAYGIPVDAIGIKIIGEERAPTRSDWVRAFLALMILASQK